MRIFKKLISIISIIIVLFVSYIIYDRNFSIKAKTGKKNMALVTKLKIGMKEDDVIRKMGKPESISVTDSQKVYNYSSNNVDYLDIEIFIDSNNRIMRINFPEN